MCRIKSKFFVYIILVIYMNFNFLFPVNFKIIELVREKDKNFDFRIFVFCYLLFSLTLFSLNALSINNPPTLNLILFSIFFYYMNKNLVKVGGSPLSVFKKTIVGLCIVLTVGLCLRFILACTVYTFGYQYTIILFSLLFSVITYLFPDKIVKTILGLQFILIEDSISARKYRKVFILFSICLICMRGIVYILFTR